MSKPKKHKWITETIKAGDVVLSVWPSKDDLSNKEKESKFFDTIQKIGDDPRVINVRKANHPDHKVVFLFDIDPDLDEEV